MGNNGEFIVPPIANNVCCQHNINNNGLSISQQQPEYHQRRTQHSITIEKPSTTSMTRVISGSTKNKLHHRSRNTSNSSNAMRKKSFRSFYIGFVVVVLWFIGVCVWVVNHNYHYAQFEALGLFKLDTSLPLSPIQLQKYHVKQSNDNLPRNTKIPHTLIFTHHVNLLTTNLDHLTSDEKTARQYTDTEVKELLTLQYNVHRIIALHTNDDKTIAIDDPTMYGAFDSNHNYDINSSNNDNNITVRFLTDDDCIVSIQKWAQLSSRNNHTDILHPNNSKPILPPKDIANELISYFQKENIGMYKADLCRGVALYETGGIYMDVDLGPRMNIFKLLLESSEFVTVKVHRQSSHPGAFFQAFIAVVPQHEVIHRYIQLFILHYRRTIKVGKGPLGVLLLKRAYDEIQLEQEDLLQQQYQTRQKHKNQKSPSTTNSLKTHLQQTSELWQEILYIPAYHDNIFSHVPIPTWGYSRRACKFVVVIPPTPISSQRQTATIGNNNTTAITGSLSKKLTVPMYSRIAGSRMCPK